jgi:hypothetical protein
MPEQHAGTKPEADIKAVPYPDRIRLKARRDTLTHEIADLKDTNAGLRGYLDELLVPWLAENDAAIEHRQATPSPPTTSTQWNSTATESGT